MSIEIVPKQHARLYGKFFSFLLSCIHLNISDFLFSFFVVVVRYKLEDRMRLFFSSSSCKIFWFFCIWPRFGSMNDISALFSYSHAHINRQARAQPLTFSLAHTYIVSFKHCQTLNHNIICFFFHSLHNISNRQTLYRSAFVCLFVQRNLHNFFSYRYLFILFGSKS